MLGVVQKRPLHDYEVPAKRVNTTKSTYTFTSVVKETKSATMEIFQKILFSF